MHLSPLAVMSPLSPGGCDWGLQTQRFAQCQGQVRVILLRLHYETEGSGKSWSLIMLKLRMIDCTWDWFLVFSISWNKRLHLRQKNKRKSNDYCTVVLNSLRIVKFVFFYRFNNVLLHSKAGHQMERGAWMLCYAAVHFQYIIALIILKWLQLVKCQARFVLARWLADKVAQRYVKRLIAVGFH